MGAAAEPFKGARGGGVCFEGYGGCWRDVLGLVFVCGAPLNEAVSGTADSRLDGGCAPNFIFFIEKKRFLC